MNDEDDLRLRLFFVVVVFRTLEVSCLFSVLPSCIGSLGLTSVVTVISDSVVIMQALCVSGLLVLMSYRTDRWTSLTTRQQSELN